MLFFRFSQSYDLTKSGGGIFYNLSIYFFKNNLLLFSVSLISFVILLIIFNYNRKNLILFLCIILSNPQLTIWQTNHSPTMFLIMLLFKINFLNKNLSIKSILSLYLYYLLFVTTYFCKNFIDMKFIKYNSNSK